MKGNAGLGKKGDAHQVGIADPLVFVIRNADAHSMQPDVAESSARNLRPLRRAVEDVDHSAIQVLHQMTVLSNSNEPESRGNPSEKSRQKDLQQGLFRAQVPGDDSV